MKRSGREVQVSQIRKTWRDMVFETDYHGTTGLAMGIAAIDTALWDCLGSWGALLAVGVLPQSRMAC